MFWLLWHSKGPVKEQNQRSVLQAMSFLEWRAALWSVLHGTYRSRPSPLQVNSSKFQEDVFVFTWLRLQKAIESFIATILESGGQLDSAMDLQRLRGIAEQVRLCCLVSIFGNEPHAIDSRGFQRGL